MLPDVSDVLMDWERSVTIKNVVRTTTNFVESDAVTERSQLVVVQVADKSRLNSVTVNWALKYIQVHSRTDILMGEYIEFDDADYKVIARGDWNGYGYIEVIAEATGLPLIT